MHDHEAIRSAVAPVLAELKLSLYDVEFSGTGRARVVRVTVESPNGIGIDELTDATRALDPIVEPLVTGAFQLEVSSPGLERTLRRPEHFDGAVGQMVSVKYRAPDGSVTRVRAQLSATTATTIELLGDAGQTFEIPHDAITAAHTVFEWGPAPKPGSTASRSKSGSRANTAASRTKETTQS